VAQQAAGGVGAAEAVAGAGWIYGLGGGDGNGLRRVHCREDDGVRTSLQHYFGETGAVQFQSYGFGAFITQ
jgi:hypothetical protein